MKSSLGSDSSCRVRVTSSCNLRKEIRSDQGMLSGKRSMESPQDMVWDTEKVKVAPAAHITWLRAGLLSFSPAMARTKRTPAHSARLSHLTDLLSCRVNVGHTSPDCPTVAHMSWHTLHPAPCTPGWVLDSRESLDRDLGLAIKTKDWWHWAHVRFVFLLLDSSPTPSLRWGMSLCLLVLCNVLTFDTSLGFHSRTPATAAHPDIH